MAVEIRAVRQATLTATGNQDFDVSGWSTTPQAALYFITRATADNSAADHGVMGIGLAVSSSNRFTGGVRNEHGTSQGDASRRTISDECIVVLDPADGSVDGEADFVQFNAGGSQVNWGDAPASAYLMTALYFAGFDNVDLQKVDMDASSPQTVTVGFEADIVIIVSTNGTITDTVHNNSELGMGFAVNGGGQGHMDGYSKDGSSFSEVLRGISNTKFWGAGTATNWYYTISIGNFDSTGFDLTRTGTTDTTDDLFIISLKLPSGLSAWCGGIASPISIGDDAQTGPGFKPQALLGVISDLDAFDSWDVTADAGGWGVVVATGSEQFSHCIADEDGADTMNTESLVDDQLVHLHSGDGSNQLEATLSSFDTNGWTPNYSVVDTGTARQQIWLAIEEDAGTLASDSQQAYTQGLTYFPFTEYFTGQADEADWLKSKWVNEAG